MQYSTQKHVNSNKIIIVHNRNMFLRNVSIEAALEYQFMYLIKHLCVQKMFNLFMMLYQSEND